MSLHGTPWEKPLQDRTPAVPTLPRRLLMRTRHLHALPSPKELTVNKLLQESIVCDKATHGIEKCCQLRICLQNTLDHQYFLVSLFLPAPTLGTLGVF